MEKFIDWESEKLIRLIEAKRSYYIKLDPATMQAKHLLSEIEFLENDILPIIVYKNPYISDLNKFMDQKFMQAAKMPIARRFAGIMLYYGLKEPTGREIEPIAYVSTTKKLITPPDLMYNISDDVTAGKYTTLVPIEL